MNKKDLIQNSGILFLALALGACGSSGGGTSNPQNGDALKLNVSALSTKKVVVAAAPKTKLDTMLAFLGSKEAVAALPNLCGAGNDGRTFDLTGGGFVCLTEALLVYEEVELENENSAVKDEFESGPYLVDMIGIPDDGIASSVSLDVPDTSTTFNKLELKVGDLDDDDNSGTLDDSSTDDYPEHDSKHTSTTKAGIDNAEMINKSIKITGQAHDGLNGAPTDFTFFSNIEGKLEMPFTFDTGNPVVLDGSTLVTFVDLQAGFDRLAFNDFSATMDGSFGKTQTGDDETCKTLGINKAQQLACDSVKNVELYHDDDDNDDLSDDHRHGGKGGFDDSGNKD